MSPSCTSSLPWCCETWQKALRKEELIWASRFKGAAHPGGDGVGQEQGAAAHTHCILQKQGEMNSPETRVGGGGFLFQLNLWKHSEVCLRGDFNPVKLTKINPHS